MKYTPRTVRTLPYIKKTCPECLCDFTSSRRNVTGEVCPDCRLTHSKYTPELIERHETISEYFSELDKQGII